MARLNEPPVAGESVEALKRRFIRQNREIARANSTQSLRIRTLEAETSRLLSENITLREENIKLRHEIEQGQEKLALENVGTVKEKLEVKLVELCNLVADLGKTPPEASPLYKRANRRTPKRSLAERNWKSTLSMSEALADGRLPPIVEGKYYPRRTLDGEELHTVLVDPTNITDSPELGPPPIAHFDEGDPIKHDSVETCRSSSPSKDSVASKFERKVSIDNLFANLETRRKRREDSLKKDTDREPSVEPNPHSLDSAVSASGHSLKVGAKRKLSTRDGDQASDQASSKKDDFAFSRRSSSMGQDRVARKGSQEVLASKSLQGGSRDNSRETSRTATGRKALGEKSVNTDPVNSPVKSRTREGDKVKDAEKDQPRKPRGTEKAREKPATVRVVRPPTLPIDPEPTSISPTDLPPVTPAPQGLDLFSPLSSEYPNTQPEPPGTPPPTDLVSQSTNATGRPSRRQRASVSYAEPNLRDKMRRPTKELADAVSSDLKIVRVQRTKPRSEGKRATPTPADGKRSVAWGHIKQEDELDDQSAWKSLPAEHAHQHQPRAEPTSPLDNKTSASAPVLDADLPSTVLMDRKRRSSILQQQQPASTENLIQNSNPASTTNQISSSTTSSSSSTIAALMTKSQKRLSRAREATAAQRQQQQNTTPSNLSQSEMRDRGWDNKEKGDNVDTFSLPSSSALDDAVEDEPDLGGGAAAASSREARKKGDALAEVEGKRRGRMRETMGSAAPLATTITAASRTSQDVSADPEVGERSSGTVAATATASTARMPSSSSYPSSLGGGARATPVERAERAAMRRRSMVL